MLCIRAHQVGGPEALQADELPTPEPGAGQALVRVEAAGVNYIDVYHRTGLYPRPLPFAPGSKARATVEAVGARRHGPRASAIASPGRRLPGSYASARRRAGASSSCAFPTASTRAIAAAAMLQGMTAHYLAHDVPLRGRATPASCTRRPAASGSCSASWPSGAGAR